MVTGGTARPESYELVGPVAERALEGCASTSRSSVPTVSHSTHGLTTHHEVEAHTNRVLLERARSVVAVADSSKLGVATFARICPLVAVDELITDLAAAPSVVESMRDAGVTVTMV